MLGREELDLNDFFQSGGSSIKAIMFATKIKSRWDIDIPLEIFFETPSVDWVSCFVADALENSDLRPLERKADPSLRNRTLSAYEPPPNRHWYLKRTNDLDSWGSTYFFEFKDNKDRSLYAQDAVAFILEKHPGLRIALQRDSGRWQESILPTNISTRFQCEDLSSIEPDMKPLAVENLVGKAQKAISLDVSLINVTYLKMGQESQDQILFSLHHMIFDPITLQIIMEDFTRALGRLEVGDQLKPSSSSENIYDWVEDMKQWAQIVDPKEFIEYRDSLQSVNGFVLPTDFPFSPAKNRMDSLVRHSRVLDEEVSKQLWSLYSNEKKDRNVMNLLLASLTECFALPLGQRALCFELVDAGRISLTGQLKMANIAGWLLEYPTVCVDLEGSTPGEESITKVAAAIDRDLRLSRGVSVLQCYSPDPEVKERVTRAPEAELSVNFLPPESKESRQPPENSGLRIIKSQAFNATSRECVHKLSITIRFSGSVMITDWDYSSNLYESSTIESYCTGFIDQIKLMVMRLS